MVVAWNWGNSKGGGSLLTMVFDLLARDEHPSTTGCTSLGGTLPMGEPLR